MRPRSLCALRATYPHTLLLPDPPDCRSHRSIEISFHLQGNVNPFEINRNRVRVIVPTVSDVDPLLEVHEATRHLRQLEEQLAAARANRDVAINRAWSEGNAIRVIAQAADLTPARIAGLLGHPFRTPGRPRQG